MDPLTVLPDPQIVPLGDVSNKFLNLGISSFKTACQYIHKLPYGYNSIRDDIMILFKEEYLIYRNALKDNILKRQEFEGVGLKTVLMAREQGLVLPKSNLPGP
jgi:hypothetical protein